MKLSNSLMVLLLLFVLSGQSLAQKSVSPILLWPDGAPGATGTSDEDKPALYPVLPSEVANTGAAVLICPGGGFTVRAVDHEGVLVSQWLKQRGIASFILRYRLRPLYSRPEWLRDAQRAMQYIRANASEYRISPERIGAIGFSAGAQLAADISCHSLSGQKDAADKYDRVSSRPDFLILGYGSMTLPAPSSASVFPPTFMYCTAEDAGQMRGMTELYGKLHQAQIPVEAHFFAKGVHGTGFAQGDPILGEWPGLLHKWMLGHGFLTSLTRSALSGVVKLDGSPLLRGIVILTPVDQPNAPPVTAYITNAHTEALGSFTISQSQGPVAGRYRVEIRQEATRWLSNSRDPLMIRMMTKQREGTLTEADRQQWGEYVRQRDLSPSIENQRVFSRQRPGDKNDYIVKIAGGKTIILNLEFFSH
jgi:hypothetical protein